MPSMADLLLEALDKLIEGDGMGAWTEGINSGGLFSTGSGRPVALSEKAVRKARTLVGEESNNNNKRKQAFNDGAGPEGEQTKLDVPLGGGMDGMEQFQMFQTGSGRAVSISMTSVKKAKAVPVLEESKGWYSCRKFKS
ncbi:hypothetical protein U9M48_020862 [Paspalum notatum var. saurae]|uniref:Uncharacterized protein n=1 Tax=Paspalum notatum var. saurae TaxID=547442 RepID=A0AAQ3TH61_PASNO